MHKHNDARALYDGTGKRALQSGRFRLACVLLFALKLGFDHRSLVGRLVGYSFGSVSSSDGEQRTAHRVIAITRYTTFIRFF